MYKFPTPIMRHYSTAQAVCKVVSDWSAQPKVISMVIDAHARNRVRNTCASHMGR